MHFDVPERRMQLGKLASSNSSLFLGLFLPLQRNNASQPLRTGHLKTEKKIESSRKSLTFFFFLLFVFPAASIDSFDLKKINLFDPTRLVPAAQWVAPGGRRSGRCSNCRTTNRIPKRREKFQKNISREILKNYLYLLVMVESVECETQSVLTGLRLKSCGFPFALEEFADGRKPLQSVEIPPLVEDGQTIG